MTQAERRAFHADHQRDALLDTLSPHSRGVFSDCFVPSSDVRFQPLSDSAGMSLDEQLSFGQGRRVVHE